MDISNNTKKFWKKLKINDVIGLQDKQAIEDQMEEGKDLGETDYEVKSIKTFNDEGNLAEYLLIDLERENENILLAVKIVDDTVSQRIYFKVEDFEEGNRLDIINRKDEWVFEEPADPSDFEISDLQYASTIEQQIDEEEVEFYMLPQGELYGECTSIPKESGIGNIFLTLVEYTTDVDCINPFMLITEEEVIQPDEEPEEVYDDYNDVEDNFHDEFEESYDDGVEEDESDEEDTGGLITLYLGADLSPLDFNVYPIGNKGK